MPKIDIKGIQEAQQGNLTLVRNMRPTGAMGRMVQFATIQAHRYAVTFTHVISGALRASHRIEVQGSHGQIYIDPASVNPKGQRPSRYGPQEHAKGGSHAFYRRVPEERGGEIGRAASYGFVKELR